MSNFKQFVRTNIAEMMPYTEGMDLTGVSISNEDLKALSPKAGDMIARNPENHDDMWLISKDYFEANFGEISEDVEQSSEKSLGNTDTNPTKSNVKDLVFWGDGDIFKLIRKASSKDEGWMKSTKAMDIEGSGCVIQVTTQQGTNVAEAITFVPNVKIKETLDDKGKVISRKIIKQ